MNTKEKLDMLFKFSALAVFACLGSGALDHKEDRQMHHFKAGMPHMSGAEGMCIMEMDDMNHAIDDLEDFDIQIDKEIIDGEEKVKIIVNGKELSANEYKRLKSKNGSWMSQKGPKTIMKKKMMHHKSKVCETCEEKQMMCEDCKNKSLKS